MSSRTLGLALSQSTRVATGTYTGDGAATQAIVGVGFQPRYVQIYERAASDNQTTIPFRLSSALLTWMIWAAGGSWFEPDLIISLDADGFTVGDGTGTAAGNSLNQVGHDYTYICVG